MADDGLSIRERLEWYWVTGATREQIGTAIRVLGPKRGGRTYAAHTDWVIDWSPKKVSVDVVMTLPRWLAATYPGELKSTWDAYVEGLLDHERGHREIAVRAAHAIRDVEGRSDLHASADAMVEIERILEQARVEEREYDELTRHGEIDPRIGGSAT